MSKNKKAGKIPQIDARSVQDISLEIGRLTEQLKYNQMCLKAKKSLILDQKREEKWQKY